jgi:hypothetical protein
MALVPAFCPEPRGRCNKVDLVGWAKVDIQTTSGSTLPCVIEIDGHYSLITKKTLSEHFPNRESPIRRLMNVTHKASDYLEKKTRTNEVVLLQLAMEDEDGQAVKVSLDFRVCEDDEFLDGMVIVGEKRLLPALQICYGGDVQHPHIADRRKDPVQIALIETAEQLAPVIMSNLERYTKRSNKPKPFRSDDEYVRQDH